MANSTYIEKFNFYLNTFLVELNTIVPEFKEVITKNYSDILANSNSNSDKCVKEFMTSISKYHTEISEKNDKLFKGVDSIYILNDVDFRELWAKDLSDSTREKDMGARSLAMIWNKRSPIQTVHGSSFILSNMAISSPR